MIRQHPSPEVEDQTFALKKIARPADWFEEGSYEVGIWHEGSRFMQCFNDSKAFKTDGAMLGVVLPCRTSANSILVVFLG